MSALPKVSIIVPSFNQGKFIKYTLDSIINQKYPDLEIIVMDGGSTDETIKILKSFGNKIIWYSKKDNGQTDALNRGIKKSTGEIIGWLNSDDCYQPNILFTIAKNFQQNKCQWLTGYCQNIDAKGNEIRSIIATYKNFLLRHFSYSALLVENFISQPSTFFHRSIIDEFGYLDENDHYTMDYEYWLRIAKKYPPLILPQYLAQFRIHSSSKTNAQINKQHAQRKKVVRKYSHNFFILQLNSINCWFIRFFYKFL